MAQDPRAKASGRSGQNSFNRSRFQNAGNSNDKKPADTSYDQYTDDLAANIVKQAYQEAEQLNQQLPPGQRDDVRFSAEAPSLYQQVQSGIASLATGLTRDFSATSSVFSHALGLFNPDIQAPTQRDQYLRANYLPDAYLKQNTEIALARLIGHDPSLVRHPHLLFNAAIKDMKTHDVQRLATYADLAKAYNALIANPDGFQNAAKSMMDRMQSSSYSQHLAFEGKMIDTGLKYAGKVVKPVLNFVNKTRALSDANAAEVLGVKGDLVTDQNGKTSFQVEPNQDSAGAMIFGGLKAVEQAPGAAINWAFDVQRNIRTLHDIKATQGDDAYYAALASIVGTTAVLTFATEGFGILLRKLETKGLQKALSVAGVDIETSGLAELRRLAYDATTPAKHLRYIKAVNQFIKRIPPAQQGQVIRALAEEGIAASRPEMIANDIAGNVNAYTRAEGIGLSEGEQLTLFPREEPLPTEPTAPVAEGEVPLAGETPAPEPLGGTSIFNTLGEIGGRGIKTASKVISNTAGLGWKYPKVPMNFQLGGELVFDSGAFGTQPKWKESWDQTYDGENYTDPHTHRKVSLGRDVAGTVFEPGSFWYNAVSGPLDLLTYFAFDPTMAVLKPLTAARQLPPLRNVEDVQNLFATNINARNLANRIVDENLRASSKMAEEVTRLRRAYNARGKEWREIITKLRASGMPEAVVRRVGGRGLIDSDLERIARAINPDVDSYATLARVFEPLTKAVKIEGQEAPDIIGRLTSAQSFDDVVHIFGDLADAQALLDPRRIASYGYLTAYKDSLYAKNRERLLNPSESAIIRATEKVQAKLARGMVSIKPIFFPELHAFSNQIARVGDPASLGMLRRALLAAGRRPDTVELVINRLARSGSPEEYNAVYKNFIQDTFKADADKFVESLVEYGNFNRLEGAILRNALLKPFQEVIAALGQTAGGGGLENKFTGTAANEMVSKNSPLDGSYPTFGLVENHEHYFALPNYKEWDNFKQSILEGLTRSDKNSLRSHIMSKADEIIGKPFDDAIAREQRVLNDWNRQYGNAKSRLEREEPGTTSWTNAYATLQNSIHMKTLIEKNIERIVGERAAEVEKRIGNFEFYSNLGKLRNKANVGIHNFHEQVRHWLVDQFFRQMALATGSFSMRVGSSEAIASVFRLGAKEYSKNWLANKVATGVAEAVRTQERKVVVPEKERNVIMQMVYDTLQAIHTPIKNAKNETLTGLARGLDLDKFVERLARDIYERNGHLWGIGASHHQIDDYQTFHNLASGHGTGKWEYSSIVDKDYLAGLTKALNDRAQSRVSRNVAEILDRNMSRTENIGADFDARVLQAKQEATDSLRHMIASDPSAFTNLTRVHGNFVNRATAERIIESVKNDLGVSEITTMAARNELARRMNEVDPVAEYANALVEDLLWLTHGRGQRNINGVERFSSDDAGDKVFHTDILRMIANGRVPRNPDEIRDLYLHPTAEQARIEYRRSQARPKAMEPMSHHSVLYEPGYDPSDFASMTPEERKHFGIPAFEAHPLEARREPEWFAGEMRKYIAEASRVKQTGFQNKFAGPSKKTLDRQYEAGASVRFPANVPTQKPLEPSSMLETLSRNLVSKPASAIHDTISTPVINGISRNPLYATEFNREMDALEPLVNAGVLPDEVAMNVARQRAIEHAIKFVHNPQDRYVLEQWARGFAPFWFAKNQALRRAGRLALENPARFEQYVRAMLVMQNYGANSVQNGEQNSALLLPGSIMGGRLMTHFLHTLGLAPAGGVPIGLTGSMGSLASVFPWTDPTGMNTGNVTSIAESIRPDFGPMVSLPMRWIALGNPYNKNIQEINDLALGHIGSNSSLFQQLVPNSLVRSLVSLGLSAIGTRNSVTNSIDAVQGGLISQALEDRHRQLYNNAIKVATKNYEQNYAGVDHPPNKEHWIHTIATAYVNEGIYDGDKLVQHPIAYYIVDPIERQHLIDSTHQAAMAIYAGRTALSFMSPLSLSTTQVNPEMMKLVHDVQKTNGDFSQAEKLFWKHPEAIYYALHRTASETGVSLPATLDMAKFQMDNSDLFAKGGLSSGLIAFVPYSNEGNVFDSHEYHSQLAAGLRRQLTPDEFMKSMARAVGNNYAYNYLPKVVDNVFNGNSTILRQAKARYAQGNPLWAKTLGDTTKSRITALSQIRELLSTPGIDQRTGFKKTAPLVREIVGKYDEFSRRYKYADPGYHDYVETQWENWLAKYVSDHPEITIGFNSIFQGLKLRDNK